MLKSLRKVYAVSRMTATRTTLMMKYKEKNLVTNLVTMESNTVPFNNLSDRKGVKPTGNGNFIPWYKVCSLKYIVICLFLALCVNIKTSIYLYNCVIYRNHVAYTLHRL